ncbi:MAG: M56 family metallopeptidase, partial [Pirellulales bacterium]
MTWGLLRPMVLVPEDWRDWPPERQRCVLLHELAHVKRLDVVFQMIGRLAAALYWFNPLVWFAVRQLRIERELACDDCVLASGERASDYARELLKIAKLYRPRPLAAGVAMAHSARLDRRVLRILDRARARWPMSPRAARSLFVTAAVLVLGVAATSLVERSTSAVAREQAAAAPEREADKANEVSPGKVTARGVVLTPDDEPAAGARVYALEVTSSSYLGNEKVRVLAETLAANDGAFSLSYTKPERTDQRGVNQSVRVHYTTQFVATTDGYAIGLANNDGDGNRDAIRIQLAPPQALDGRLIDVEGRPLAGAAIHVKAIAQAGEPLDAWFTRAKANSHPDEYMNLAMRKAGERRPWPVSFPSQEKVALAATPLAPTATSDSDGRFSIPNIGPDRLVVLEVAAPTVARTILKMVSHRGPNVYDAFPDPRLHDRMIHGAGATVVVGPAAAVKGVVADAETGQPIANCRVEVTQVAGSLMAVEDFAHTTTDEAGRYLLGRLPLDPPDSRGYRLRFTPPAGAAYFSTEFPVRLGGDNFETMFDVRLPRARFISGRITDNATGQPVRALVGYLPTYDNKGASAYPNFQPQMRTVALGDFRWNEADGSFRMPAINGRGVLCVTAERTAAYALAGHADRIEGLQAKGDKFGVFHLWDASMCNEFREINLTD